MSTRTETEFLEEENASLREQLAAALKRLDDLEDWTTMLIQRDEARAVVREILDAFGPSGSGHTARVGQVQIGKWRKRTGLE